MTKSCVRCDEPIEQNGNVWQDSLGFSKCTDRVDHDPSLLAAQVDAEWSGPRLARLAREGREQQ